MRLKYIALLGMVSGLVVAADDHRPAITAAGQVPLSFERASSGNTRWTARGNGYRLAVGAGDVEVGLNDEQLRIVFVGANQQAASTGLDALPGKVNYLVGRDQKAWLRDIPTYGRVVYKDLYPGIDTIWYGRQGRLEYDLNLQPGADPGKIAMRFEGARKLSMGASGELRVEMPGGSLSLQLPEVYQEADNGRKRIVAGYELRADNEVGFRLAGYDKARPLTIDPTLVYATYFGSNLPTLQGVAVDTAGNVYIGGTTNGNFIPSVSAVQSGLLGQQNAFIAKFDPTGTTLLYSTYLGGSQYDYLQGIAVEPATGNLVAAGYTSSPDFPLVNPVQSTLGAGETAFAFRLNPSGNGLVYSTYLAGSGSAGNAVALDTTGNAYIAGTASAFQSSSGAVNNCCAFVEKLSPTGSQIYGAQIGTTRGLAIAVDSAGAAYLAGASTASSFPNNPPGAHTSNAGGFDAFAAKLSPDATSVTWATFLGGAGNDSANAIALGAGNVVYLGGYTGSSNLPVTAGVVQGTYGGGQDGFLANLTADGSAFSWVTYLGGAKSETLASISVISGALLVAGNTFSRDFPTASALQPALPGPPNSFFKSTNSGALFTASDSGLPGSSAGAGTILPDPLNAGTLVVDSGAGVYRSTDDGASWTNVQPSSNGVTVRSRSNSAVLYSTDGCAVYKSTNAGQTWTSPHTCVVDAFAAVVSPTNSNILLLFAAGAEYRSTDGGVTFAQSAVPFFAPTTFAASADGSIYAASEFSGLYKSTNSGVTWVLLGGGAPGSPLTVAVSGSAPANVYASDGLDVYKSTNSGATWTLTGAGIGVAYLTVDPAHPQTVYGAYTWGSSILVSTDGGSSWAPTGALLDSGFINGIAVSPSNSAELYVSDVVTQSGFVSKLTTDGKTLTWSTFYGPYDYAQVAGAAPGAAGKVWVAGSVDSASLPITPNARNGNTYAAGTAFLGEIQDTTASCAYTISPAGQYSYAPGRLVFAITSPTGCAWTATTSDSWVHIVRTSGTGSGTIPLAVDANNTAGTRNGSVSVGGQTYNIVQPSSSCSYGLSFPSLTSAGGSANITVTAPAGCPWDVEFQNSDPAHVTSALTGTGNGNVTVSVPANSSVQNLAFGLQIGGTSTGISQQNACVFSFPNGTGISLPAGALQNNLQINANLNGCQWNGHSDQGWVSLNNALGNGSGMLSYTLALNLTGADRSAHIFVGSQSVTITQATAEFADVTPADVFFDAANLMFQAGVTTGCVTSAIPATRLYCPTNNVTRQEMAAFIVRAVTGTVTPALFNPTPFFTDVPATNSFFPHIQKLEELAITTGCQPSLFCPLDPVPRWQMGIFMVRARLALNGAAFSFNPVPYFADVPTNVEGNGTAFPFIQRTYEEHVTTGCGTNPLVYCPDNLVTRGEMASFIMRALFNQTTILGPTAPQVISVSPNAISTVIGTQLTVTITGSHTSFQNGDTVTIPSGMLTVSNVIVNSATSISAKLTANSNVVAGPQALIVTSGGQNLTLPLAIKVGTY